LFAKASKGKGKSRRHETNKASREIRGVNGSGDLHGDGEYGVDDEGIGGYEEDDEWDSADEETDEVGDELSGGSAIYPKRSVINPDFSRQNPLSFSPSHALNLNAGLPSSSNTTSKYNTAVSAYTLLRFSTGQKLEDEYQLSWYDLAPNELLELYAHVPVQHLPASFGLPNPDPHTSKPRHTPKSAQHARTGSTSSLSRQLSRTHANSSNADPNPPLTLPTRTYFPALNRSSPASYVQPYWEGYVRALRVVWREESTASYSAYGRGGGVGEAAIGGFVPALAVMGQDPAGRDLRAMEMKEGGYGGYGAGFVDMSGNKREEKAMSKTTRLEWRLRWAVVRDGMLYLSKDREVGNFLYDYTRAILTCLFLLRTKHLPKLILFLRSQRYAGQTTLLHLRTLHDTRPRRTLPRKVTRIANTRVLNALCLVVPPRCAGTATPPPWIAIIPNAATVSRTWIQTRKGILRRLVYA
jgi:hypothetical protein